MARASRIPYDIIFHEPGAAAGMLPAVSDARQHAGVERSQAGRRDGSWAVSRFERDRELSMSDVTLMLQAVGRGEKHASEELLPLVYRELRRLAAMHMARQAAGQTLQPTALVHEAWMRLVDDGARTWENRAHFFGAAAEAMRRILIESARRKSRLKRGGDRIRVDLEAVDLEASTPDDRVLLIDEALARLEQKDPELARIVTLKFFGGLTNEEVAELLRINERTVRRHWTYAKAWLLENIREEL